MNGRNVEGEALKGDSGPRHFAGARDAPVFGNPEVYGRLRDVVAQLAPPPTSRLAIPHPRQGDRTEMATAPLGRHDDDRDFFKVKRIDFLGAKRAIVCQNENGPCPLIGIVNVLLLRNAVTLQGAPDRPEVSAQELMSLVAARILDENARQENDSSKGDFEAMDAEQAEAMRQNQEQNVSDAMAALPSLATGLDVNVRFRHALDFEFTAELAIFDLLDVTLCHAWVADPAHHPEAAAAIGARGYNQLMERVIELTCAAEEAERVAEEAERVAASVETDSVPGEGAPGGDASTRFDADARMNRSRSEEEMVRRAMQLSLEEAGGNEEEGNEEEDVVAAIVSELVSRAATASEEREDADADDEERESSRRESSRGSALLGDVLAERYALDDFLASSASQLTRGGLASALERVNERELVVFFRNNHFSTAFKLDGVLYNLVTDQGYLGEPDVVWEVLAVGDGGTKGDAGGTKGDASEGTFVDGAFKAFTPHLDPGSTAVTTEEDAQMAAALLASVRDAHGGPGVGGAGEGRTGGPGEGPPLAPELPGDFLRPAPPPERALAAAPDADYALAVQLQAEYEEEARRADEARRRSRAEAERSRAAEAERAKAAEAKKKKKKKASSSYGSDCVVM